MGGLPLSRREVKCPGSTRGGGPVRLSPAPLGRARDARRAHHGGWFSDVTHVWRGENIFAGARFIFPARPNSGYFRSLHFLRLFRMIRFSELAGKILHLRRSQYEFNLKISVKLLTSYSLLSYVGTL